MWYPGRNLPLRLKRPQKGSLVSSSGPLKPGRESEDNFVSLIFGNAYFVVVKHLDSATLDAVYLVPVNDIGSVRFNKVFRQTSTNFTDSGPCSYDVAACAKNGYVVVLAFNKANVLIRYGK